MKLVLLPNVIPAVLKLDDSAEDKGLHEGFCLGFGREVVAICKR